MNHRNLITALAIAALLTVAVTTSGCSTNTSPTPTPVATKETTIGNNTTVSSADGFNITYPNALKIDSTTNASIPVRVYVYLATNNTIDAVVVATYNFNATATLSDFVNFNINAINDYPSYQLISNNSTTIAGTPAFNVVWQATVPVQLGSGASNIQDTTLKVMQTFVVNKNKGYVITYKATLNDYNTYLAQARRIMDSFVMT